MTKSKSPSSFDRYNANDGNFQTELYTGILRDAFGEDIGQNSWSTAHEQDGFLKGLDLTAGKILLDVGCGAGGPAPFVGAAESSFFPGMIVYLTHWFCLRELNAGKRSLSNAAQGNQWR